MRTPLGIGLVVGAVILLTLLALIHLTFSPRRPGRWLWLIVIVVLPVLGPLLYAVAGSRADPEDWDEYEAYRAEHAPAPVLAAPAQTEPVQPALVETTPTATPTPSDVYRDDIDAPAIAVSAVDEGSTEDETSPDFTVRDDGAALPNFAVRDVHVPLTDDVPSESAYDSLDAQPLAADLLTEDEAESRDGDAQETEAYEATDVPTVEVEDPSEAPPLSSVPADEPSEAAARPDPPRDHLRARRRKSR